MMNRHIRESHLNTVRIPDTKTEVVKISKAQGETSEMRDVCLVPRIVLTRRLTQPQRADRPEEVGKTNTLN